MEDFDNFFCKSRVNRRNQRHSYGKNKWEIVLEYIYFGKE